MKQVIIGLLLAVALAGCASQSGRTISPAEQKLIDLYEAEWNWRQREFGYEPSETGYQRTGGWPDVTPEAYAQRLSYWEAALATLDDIDLAALSDEGRINAAVFRRIVESEANNARYRTYEAPLNSDTFFWGNLDSDGGASDLAAYERHLSRMRALPDYFEQQIANMRAGLARGFTPAAISLKGRSATIDVYLQEGEDNPFFAPALRFPNSIDDVTAERLRKDMLASIRNDIVPAYRRLKSFFDDEYLPNARRTLGASELPDGDAFYEAQILEFTTLDLTPEQIHEKGLSEVARIRQAMLDVIDELGFDGGLPEFFEFLRTDPQFYARTPDELMGVSAYVDKRMAGHIHDVLGFLPRQRHTILPVPDSIAPTYTAGRGGYGKCWMNTYNLPARPLYTIPALTLHECSPGHSLQGAISREAPGDIPDFRAYNYFSGYGEGWGLYVEWLGGELGIYRTPYERFGQLTYEMWRACRLVIDTGVHRFGWSRERALAYLRDNAALSEHEVTTEVDRYISWPGQALAYKLGEMLIREKRAEAEQRLGTAFDQRYFHDKILALRSVPLSVLSDELDRWIAAGGPNPYEGMDID